MPPLIHHSMDDKIIIQSTVYESGIPRFVLTIDNDLTFTGYHFGVRHTIKTLSANRVCKIDKVSNLMEAINYLNNLDLNNKKKVLMEQISSMNSLTYIGEKKYSNDQ